MRARAIENQNPLSYRDRMTWPSVTPANWIDAVFGMLRRFIDALSCCLGLELLKQVVGSCLPMGCAKQEFVPESRVVVTDAGRMSIPRLAAARTQSG
jgi:hypothetical protein